MQKVLGKRLGLEKFGPRLTVTRLFSGNHLNKGPQLFQAFFDIPGSNDFEAGFFNLLVSLNHLNEDCLITTTG